MGKVNCSMGSTLPTGAKPTANAQSFGCDACQYIHENEEYTCSDFVALSGKNPQSEEQFTDMWKCSRTWIPILLVENSQRVVQTNASVQSLRNEQVKGQQQFLALVNSAKRAIE